jgi:hypothetical protein
MNRYQIKLHRAVQIGQVQGKKGAAEQSNKFQETG